MTTVETNTGGGPSDGLSTAALLVGAISLGALVGWLSPEMGERLSGGVDPTLLLLVALLFFEVRLRAVAAGFANLRFMSIAWGANFLIVPVIGFIIASLFLSGQPLLFTGLLIYFISPCTDWFLGFTRMARSDTALGAALIPVNMVSQLLLYPVWLWLFTRHTGVADFGTIPDVLLHWFLIPFAAAQALRFALERLLSGTLFARLSEWVGLAIPLVTAALIVQIFAANIGTIAGHLGAFAVILIAIFLFFVATFLMGEGLARLFRLPYPQQALLAMATAARNAPLMLAVTAVAIPDQPLILAAIVIGMLVEFPHLTALKQVLLRQARRKGVSP
jgi:ACR3 family arsenite efflux pump ArsB